MIYWSRGYVDGILEQRIGDILEQRIHRWYIMQVNVIKRG